MPSFRPRFVVFLISTLLAARAVAADTPYFPAGIAGQKIHLVGNGHIDPTWLWPWQEGVSVVHSTFRSALERMKENPEFIFTASSAQFYAWVAANDPAMLAEIRQRIEEGRWEIVGGWWVEPDLNLPSGEGLVRQGLYGQRTFQRLFGRMARTGFNPDGFGHPGSLPQILKLQGLTNYTFMRPEPREKPNLTARLFWWESDDGSRILTYRIPFDYGGSGDLHLRVRNIATEPGITLHQRMGFYGVGDHGGGPTKENLNSIARMRTAENAPQLTFSSPDRYFDAVRQGGETIPVVHDELQHHAPGCYTTHSEIKKLNRTTEIALVTAEKISALGSFAWEAAYPKTDFTQAWERVLLQQFHDSLAGTALPEHYDFARAAYGAAQATATEAMSLAVQKLAWQVPTTDPDSNYFVVFNPHAWPTTLPLEADFAPAGPERAPPTRLEDETGGALPFQLAPATTEADSGRLRLVAQVPVPAFGYRQVRLLRAPGMKAPVATVPSEAPPMIENEHLRVTFDPAGSMTLFDKDASAPIVEAARALVIDDPSDTWGHKVQRFDKVVGEFGGQSAQVIESGPVRQVIRTRSAFGSSTLVIDWTLYAGDRALSADVTVDWHEHQTMLKFSFPVAVEATQATYETAYGTIVRPNSGDEEPGHRWVNVTGQRKQKTAGLALINNAKYGYSVLGNDLRLSILRSPPFALHDPIKASAQTDHRWMDQGIQTFRLLLVPHDGSWQAARIPRLADEFTSPVPTLQQGIHPGLRPGAGSFLAVDAPNVDVAAVKLAEDNDDLIMRLVETDGQPANVTLDFKLVAKSWTGHLRPYEIKTLRYVRATGTFREVDLIEN